MRLASSTSTHKPGTHIPTELVCEERPVGDSNCKGSVERANQTIQGQTRAVKDFTERQVSARIGHDFSVLKWRVRHAARTLTTFHVRSDASEANRTNSKSLRLKWLAGCWPGFITCTGEHIVSDNTAVTT